MSFGTGFRVDRLRVSYGGQRVLDDTSGTFHAGRMSAIVGPNGAGKSTSSSGVHISSVFPRDQRGSSAAVPIPQPRQEPISVDPNLVIILIAAIGCGLYMAWAIGATRGTSQLSLSRTAAFSSSNCCLNANQLKPRRASSWCERWT